MSMTTISMCVPMFFNTVIFVLCFITLDIDDRFVDYVVSIN